MDQTTTNPLPDVGSFSYSWPTSRPKPQPEERVNHGDVAAFIGADPASASQCSFDFRLSLSVSEQTAAMADADEMFLNGLLLPLQPMSQEGEEDGDAGPRQPVLLRSLSLDSSQRMIVSASKRHQLTRPTSLNSSPSGGLRVGTVTAARSSSVSMGAVFRNTKLRLPSFGRCRKQHKSISYKYLRFLVPLYQKIVKCVRRSKMPDDSHRVEPCNGEVCDLGKESAIRDAILHCKRSL